MTATRTVTVRFPINVSPFIRGMHDVGYSMARFAANLQHQPPPPRRPYPRRHSAMTARQYRADRRRYGREVRAYRRAVRSGGRA